MAYAILILLGWAALVLLAQARAWRDVRWRAAFMQKIVAETYPTKPPAILQGVVKPKTDDRDRNVELILFVDW